jgi:hypothetical protein
MDPKDGRYMYLFTSESYAVDSKYLSYKLTLRLLFLTVL